MRIVFIFRCSSCASCFRAIHMLCCSSTLHCPSSRKCAQLSNPHLQIWHCRAVCENISFSSFVTQESFTLGIWFVQNFIVHLCVWQKVPPPANDFGISHRCLRCHRLTYRQTSNQGGTGSILLYADISLAGDERREKPL